jgi:alkylation response protein AidB-like acyl-CoA dehydrogenase
MPEKKIPAGGEFLIHDFETRDVFIPEDFTHAHQMVYAAAVDFVQKGVAPNEELIETKDEKISRSLIAKAGELGLNGTDVSEAYGGEALDKISTCLVTEAMGAAGSFGITHTIHTGIGSLPIVYFGNDAQKKKYLPRLCSGQWIGAYCLTEPGAGSDALNALTSATLSDDGRHYILNGEKIYITNGSWADCYVVYAKVDGEKFTGFIVERAFDGIAPGAEEHKMGLGGSSTSSVVLNNCKVPVENVLFEVGKGHRIAFNILNMGRYKIGANTTGASKTAIAEAARHAATRVQFGRPIGSFGMVQNKLADMAIRIYMTESMLYRLAAMIDDKLGSLDEAARKSGTETANAIEEYAVECSMVKVYGSECLDFCVDEWVQILGGAGYTAEYPAERAYRNSRINRIVEGTNEINRLLVARTLIKRATQGRLDLRGAVKAVAGGLAAGVPGSPGPGSSPLDREAHAVAMCKKMFLVALGAAVGKLDKSLADEQGVLEMLAEMVMEIFAMESGLLRAKKFTERKGEQKARYHLAAVRGYVGETVHKLAYWARQILAYADPEASLGASATDIDKLAACPPVPTIRYKREIAERVIQVKKYIF